MKSATLFALALLLSACEGEEKTLTFGLDFRVRDGSVNAEQTSELCLPPGAYDGNVSASSIDRWENWEQPPHLFLEANPDAEQNAYRVRVYSATERDETSIWWKPGEVLAERTYDSEFGERAAVDSFVVDFQGEQYTVEATGLPPDTECP